MKVKPTTKKAAKLVKKPVTPAKRKAKPVKPKECKHGCPPKQVCDFCQGTGGKDKVKQAPKPLTAAQKLDAIGIEVICDYVASGESLQSYCTNNGVSPVTMLRWINADPKRAEDYAHARDVRADLTFDRLDDLSDDAVAADNAVKVAGLRLKCDNIKWKLARMNAKKYGDKQTIDLTAEVVTLTDEQRKAKIAELEAKFKAK